MSACNDFKDKSIPQRRELLNKFRLCFNCLSSKHSRKECSSKYSCRLCQLSHHTLLHEPTSPSKVESNTSVNSTSNSTVVNQVTFHLLSQSSGVKSGSLLATTWIRVSSPDKRYGTFRSMLDQGSAMTLVTERLAQRLHLRKQRVSVAISGIGGASIAS